MSGRFAPSPTADLHLGNLRTALLAWLMARHAGLRFLLRIEDLDVARVAAAPAAADRQIADLERLGIDHDPPITRQSERQQLYAAAVARLPTYECFCTRREIAAATAAPHGAPRPYPGTCRELSAAGRAARRRDRPSALRVDAGAAEFTVTDRWAGQLTTVVDDFVLKRNDGAYSYHLAVVVDDLDQGVSQVVRGDDLWASSPRQAWLTRTLGGTEPAYAHVGLVTTGDGTRLAKRDGAITLGQLADRGVDTGRVLAVLGSSLGLCDPSEAVTASTLLERFDPATVAHGAWIWDERTASADR
ncbi:MAG: tRNA glutamyl-Q(34) synthetase GluQRS [Propioniciclava sp.]